MARMIFVNLPAKDVAKSTAFYQAIGFTRDPRFGNEVASAMNGSDGITVMILGHDFHRTFIPHKEIADSTPRWPRSPTARRTNRPEAPRNGCRRHRARERHANAMIRGDVRPGESPLSK